MRFISHFISFAIISFSFFLIIFFLKYEIPHLIVNLRKKKSKMEVDLVLSLQLIFNKLFLLIINEHILCAYVVEAMRTYEAKMIILSMLNIYISSVLLSIAKNDCKMLEKNEYIQLVAHIHLESKFTEQIIVLKQCIQLFFYSFFYSFEL